MNHIGFFDSLENNIIQGWAFTPESPDQTVYVDIFVNDKFIATVPANTYREDLFLSGIGNGFHSFNFSIHEELQNGEEFNLITIRYSGNHINLECSPKWTPCDPLTFHRMKVAAEFLRGKGIEIGALHNPLPLHQIEEIEEIKYVDRFNVDDLRKHYPELNNLPLVNVDIIDDGEKLNTIQDNSLDFIICNHMLEHCENPIGTMRNHLNKLKSCGVYYLAIPDKRFTFDKDRDLTNFSHLLRDEQEGPQHSREEHFYEWVVKSQKVQGESKIKETVASLMDMNYSIHFHVWDEFSFGNFLNKTCEYLDNCFDIQFFELNCKQEVLTILKKK